MDCLKIYLFIYLFIISDFTMLHMKCFGAWIITGPTICIKTDYVSKLYSKPLIGQSFCILPTLLRTVRKQTFKCKGKIHPRKGHEGPEGE
jgi:hypothetical protein